MRIRVDSHALMLILADKTCVMSPPLDANANCSPRSVRVAVVRALPELTGVFERVMHRYWHHHLTLCCQSCARTKPPCRRSQARGDKIILKAWLVSGSVSAAAGKGCGQTRCSDRMLVKEITSGSTASGRTMQPMVPICPFDASQGQTGGKAGLSKQDRQPAQYINWTH